MAYAMGIILFAFGILFAVCLHEAGHMGTAKAFGMKVTRYFVGFGPTLWSFRRGETEYGVKALPFGGFVKIVGMTPQDDDVDPADEPRAMWRYPVWKRTIVMSAGSATHFVLGVVILWGLFSFVPLNDEAKLQRHVDDFKAAAEHYATQDFADIARLGMTGFCFGGGITWRATTQMPNLKGSAPYYGPPPPLDAVPNIRAAVLGIYSDDPDDFANEGRDQLEAALQEAGVTHEIKVYEGTQHAFHNDTGQRYNEEQAQVAWQDMLDWFSQHLVAGGATPMATPEG